MSSEYSYDEEGQFFPFFILTVTGIVTLPLTYTLFASSSNAATPTARVKTDYKSKHAGLVEAERSAQKKRQRKTGRALFVLCGWAVMALMVYLIMNTQRTEAKLWNPYDILGISDASTEKQIKSRYRKLSQKLHPDKVKPNPAKNETIEMLNDRYVEISKAYQALTDEEVRNNYIQFGHPDGKQSMSIGIALPKALVSDGNGKFVILIYASLLGVLLPYLVGSWWYGTQRLSKEGVLMESANNLFLEYEDDIDDAAVITALSIGKEFDKVLKGDKAESGLSKLESRILAEGDLSPYAAGLPGKEKEKLESLDNGVRRKALALLWAYLGRVELDDQALTTSKYQVAPIAHSLLRSFNAICLAYGNSAPLLAAYSAAQRLIQAVPPKASPLLQLPHFNADVVRAVQGDSKVHTSVQRFMDLPDAKRRKLVVGHGLLDEQQYQTAVSAAKQLPHFRVAKAFFKVTGERFIVPASLVSLVVKGRFIPPGTENVPGIDELDLEDVDPAEDDLDAILGRKNKGAKTAGDKGAGGKDDVSISPPQAFAPEFGREHTPSWHVFLTDSKQGKIAVPPFTFTSFDKPIFDADGKPTFAMQTMKAQFGAPPQAGRYTFVMHVVCDSYVGFDTKMEVTMVVEEANKAAQMAAEDEISEPEEDSLAGAMHAMKTGKMPNLGDDSDEESGTEEEVSDTSATNTDTEPEDN